MKAIHAAVIGLCLEACSMGTTAPSPSVPVVPSFVSGTAEDDAAIRSIVASEAGDRPDVHLAADLDWENAFGIRYFDLKKRDAFYHTVVTPQMKDANDSTLEVKVRYIEPTVAVADEYWHVAGQVYTGDTKPGPDRWGRTTYFFKKENGVWIEVLERVADLRFPYYKHYDSLPTPVPVAAETLASYAGDYEMVPGKKLVSIAVKGDRLSITLRGETRVGIPLSSTEFLIVDPEDLAQYTRLTFATTADGGVTYTFADETGKTLGTLTQSKD